MERKLNVDDWENLNLDYEGENKSASFFYSQGNIHSYPAKAVPEMIGDLLIKLKEQYNISKVLDPFVGSGTTALEAKYLGLDFYGSDLNTLAILLSKTKTLKIDNMSYIIKHLTTFTDSIEQKYLNVNSIALEDFDNIEYWFKKENIRELSYLKQQINNFLKRAKSYKKTYALILLTAFSSTIRSTSLTRNGEFKLYRMAPNDIEKHNVNSLSIFSKKVSDILKILQIANHSYKGETISKIYLKNAKNLDYVKNNEVDLIITSPPYGDSQSTVAYGQFSRLSIQWMGDLMDKYIGIKCEYDNCDQYLLGGKKSDFTLNDLEGFYNSFELNKLISEMDYIITKNVNERNELKTVVDELVFKLENHENIQEEDIRNNDIVFKLIKERVRLDIYRKINTKRTNLNSYSIKRLARYKSETFFVELFGDNVKLRYKRKKQLIEKMPFVRETINRNILSMPKRKIEVIDFFKDLYKVVIETDRVLCKNGIQAWIVGHRTVLGEVHINMYGILKDWFENMGYKVITSLKRKYSFKRMPYHINSTIMKNKEINTMLNEYILIVQKQ